MSDGARTRDNRDHNPVLYQLSYTHHAAAETAAEEGYPIVAPRSAAAVASALVGPGGGTKTVRR